MELKIATALKVVVTEKKRTSSGFKRVAGIIQGVIREDEQGNFTVEIAGNDDKKEYLPLTEKSFNLTGKKYVFTRKKDKRGKRICIIRDEFHSKFLSGLPEQYLPFTKNWVVSGYIVQNGLIRQFDFKTLLGIEGYNLSSYTHYDEE